MNDCHVIISNKVIHALVRAMDSDNLTHIKLNVSKLLISSDEDGEALANVVED